MAYRLLQLVWEESCIQWNIQPRIRMNALKSKFVRELVNLLVLYLRKWSHDTTKSLYDHNELIRSVLVYELIEKCLKNRVSFTTILHGLDR